MITHIVFDQGNVLFTNDWLIESEEKDRLFYSRYKISHEQFNASRNKFNDLLTRGKLSEREYWSKLLADANAKNPSPEYAIKISRDFQKEIPGMLRLSKKLKKRGYELSILSNTHTEMIEFKKKTFKLNRLFEPIITSCQTGHIKPEQKIFMILLDEIDTEPQNCLFVDDNKSNINSAKKLHFQTHLFKHPFAFKKNLSELSLYKEL